MKKFHCRLYINCIKLFTIPCFVLKSLTVNGQSVPIKYEVEAQAIITSGDQVPFWMKANRYGSIPLHGVSGSFLGRASKDYDSVATKGNNLLKNKLFDWGFGFEGRMNAGVKADFQLIEAYGKVKSGIFQLKAGRSKDIMGLNGDTLLSSGNFAVSGNAFGIPKIEISIPSYYTIPIFEGLFSFKGNFAHGWLGRKRILETILSTSDKIPFQILDTYTTTYFHQKSFYGRFGKPGWKFKFYAGFNHQVYWGHEQDAFGKERFGLSNFETFYYVTIGKAYGNKYFPKSKIGNQLGSIDLAFEYKFDPFKVTIYRQNLYDVGALSKLANINDGLNGISFENNKKKNNSSIFRWNKILLEFFYSMNQAGYPGTVTKSGDEDYYNNSYYKDGWSYLQMGVGTPLITRKQDAKDGQAISRYEQYFINNRVKAYHLGITGELWDCSFLTKATFSQNYGTFGTSSYGRSTGDEHYPNTTNIFVPVHQFSLYLEGMKPIKNKFDIGVATALDQGKLVYNSFGLSLKVKKTF